MISSVEQRARSFTRTVGAGLGFGGDERHVDETTSEHEQLQRHGPYRGLQPYTIDDQRFFFGRAAERDILVSNMFAAPITVLYGASGVGKSSLLGAGVLPDLVASGCRSLAFREWQDEQFEASLKRQVVHSMLGERRSQPGVENLELHELLRSVAARGNRPVCIILDQFEEFFYYHRNSEAAERFTGSVARLANHPESRVNFMFALRDDALSMLDVLQGKIPSVLNNMIRLQHLSREGAREAIVNPLRVYAEDVARANELGTPGAPDGPTSIEDGLVDAIMEARVSFDQRPGFVPTADRAIETPFLQLVLERLWHEEQRQGSPVMRLTTLQRLKGANGIVRHHLDDAVASLSPRQRRVTARIFRYAVTPSGTKIAYKRGDLADVAKIRNDDTLQSTLDALARQRILRVIDASDFALENRRFEIFHDVLAAAVLDWRYRFYERQRTLRIGASVLGMVALVIGLLGLARYRGNERVAQQAAVSSRQLAASAREVLPFSTEQSVNLALRAMELRSTREAGAALRGALLEWHLRRWLRAGADSVLGVVMIPGGRRLLSATSDGVLRVWQLDNGIAVDSARVSGIRAMAVDPTGTKAVTGGRDGRVLLWDLATMQSAPIGAHREPVNDVAFDHRGERVASGSVDTRAVVWGLDGSIQNTFTMHSQQAVGAVAFAPGDTALITGDFDGDVYSWSLQGDGGAPRALGARHGGRVYSISFARDGTRLVTASRDNTARVWELQKCRPRLQCWTEFRHADWVLSATLDSSERWLATTSRNGATIIWSVAAARPALTLRGHTGSVSDAQWLPNRVLATASADGKIGLWDVDLDSTVVLAPPAAGAGGASVVATRPDSLWTPDSTWTIQLTAGGATASRARASSGRRNLLSASGSPNVLLTPDSAWLVRRDSSGTVVVEPCKVCRIPAESLAASARARLAADSARRVAAKN